MLTQVDATVPYYQPETAYQIFNRVMFNQDVATGTQQAAGYSSNGSNSAYTKSEMPPPEEQPQCYLWDILETCTSEQKNILKNGTAVVENFILIGYKRVDGSVAFYNGTNGQASGTGSSPTGTGNNRPNSASGTMASGPIATLLLSALTLVWLQTALL